MSLKNKLRKIAAELIAPMNPMQLVHGIAHAETSVPDEKSYFDDKYWIRTRVKPKWGKYIDKKTGKEKEGWIGSSTAYGPNQITHGKFDSYITKQYARDMRPHRSFYYNTMQPMYKKFLRYGMEPTKPGYNKIWDYGGRGKKFTQAEKEAYKRAVTEMMRLDYNRVLRNTRNTPLSHQGKLDRVIKLWRGVGYKDDPKYYDNVNRFLRKNYPKYYR